MALLTWQNLAIPDISSGTQQGARTASDLLSRAMGHASTGVGQLQTIENDQRAAQTQAADRFVLEKMLSAQNPEQQAQVMQGVMAGPAADLASPAALLGLDARKDFLRERNQAEYQIARGLKHDRAGDAAAPLYAKYADGAVNNPAAAIRGYNEEAKNLGLPLQAIQEGDAKLRALLHDVDPSRGINARLASDRAKNDLFAAELVKKVRREADLGKQAEIMRKGYDENPVGAGYAETTLLGRGVDVTKEVMNPNATFGVNPDGQAFLPPDIQDAIHQSEETVTSLKAGLPAASKVILNAQGMEGVGQNEATSQVAERLTKAGGKEVQSGVINQLIRKVVSKARDANVSISHAEAAGLLLDRIEVDDYSSVEDIQAGIDVNEGGLLDDARNLEGARGPLKTFQKMERAHARTVKLKDELGKLSSRAQAADLKAAADPESRGAAAELKNKLAKKRKELDDHLAANKDSGVGEDKTPDPVPPPSMTPEEKAALKERIGKTKTTLGKL